MICCQHSVSSSFLRSCSISSGLRRSIANFVGFFFWVDFIVLEKTWEFRLKDYNTHNLQEAWTISESLSLFFFTLEYFFVCCYLESISKRKSEPASSLPRVADEGETLERVPVVLVNICDSIISSIFNINIICTNNMDACQYSISISSIYHMDACRRVTPSPRSSGASFTTIIANTL